MIIDESAEIQDEIFPDIPGDVVFATESKYDGDCIETSSFLTAKSAISTNMVATNNELKDITYWVKNALVGVFGIGDYDKNIMPSLIGVSQDYINCISTFTKMGYCVLYQNKQNTIEYIDKYDAKWKANSKSTKLKSRQCKENVKTYWDDDEIEQFFVNARDYILKYQHDTCIFLLSCHGEAQGVILDSKGEEVSLECLFSNYNGKECPYLVDKPKIVFADACRGQMRGYPIQTVELKDAFQHKNDEKTDSMKSVSKSLAKFGNVIHDKNKNVVNLASTILIEH